MLDPWTGLERGRCAQPPQVWHIVPDIDKNLGYRREASIFLGPNIMDGIKVFSFDILISQYCTTMSNPISKKIFDIVSISGWQRGSKLNIVPIHRKFFVDVEVNKFDIEGGKEGFLERPESDLSLLRRGPHCHLNIEPDIVYDIDAYI
jgi:hypothetical protein